MITDSDLDLVERLKVTRNALLNLDRDLATMQAKVRDIQARIRSLRKDESDALTELARPRPMPLFTPDAAPAEEATTTRKRKRKGA